MNVVERFSNIEIEGMEVDSENSEYFSSYENLEIHEIMLKDKPRNEAYRKAIFQNKSAIEVRRIHEYITMPGFNISFIVDKCLGQDNSRCWQWNWIFINYGSSCWC